MNFLEAILDYLKGLVQAEIPELEWNGLVQKLTETDDDGKTIYHIGAYKGDGEYDEINFDSSKVQIYFRQDGEVSIKEVDEEEFMGCEIVEEATIPLRGVFIATKEFRQDDGAYAALNAGFIIKDAISITSPKALRQGTNLRSVIVRVTGIETDSQKILDEEGQEFDYKHTFVILKIQIIVQAKQGCLNFC